MGQGWLAFILFPLVCDVSGQTHMPPIEPPIEMPVEPTTPLPQTPANNQVCLIVPPDVEECYRNFQGKPIDDKSAQVNCLQKLLWNFRPDHNNTIVELNYFRSLAGDIAAYSEANILRDGTPKPPTGHRERHEYRTLNQKERQRFHVALNRLYEDGTIRAFARLHARAYQIHGNGPSSLPWFRVFLVMFEEALRRIDPTVALPYWDCTIDNDMDNPVNSAIWSPEYFGNGVGDVIFGPAAGWVTDQGNLERNYGQASRLYAKDQILKVLSKCKLEDITQPGAALEYDLEWYQGGVHAWVGGDMSAPATAGYDPIFYMHHAFNDYIWELFRRRQVQRCNLDPVTEYPKTATSGGHAPDTKMTGFEWLTVLDGLKSYWVDDWYGYQSTPTCPNCCPGCAFPAPVFCNTRRRRACVARSRRTFSFDANRPETTFSKASLDPAEIDAIDNPPPPRNRGKPYRHTPSDGRSIHTAISDAYASLSDIDPKPEPQRTRPAPRRSLGGQMVDMTRLTDPPRVTQHVEPVRDQRRDFVRDRVNDIVVTDRFAGRSTRDEFSTRTPPPPIRRGRLDPPRSDRRTSAGSRRLPESRDTIPISSRVSVPDTRRSLPERRSFPVSDRRRGFDASNTRGFDASNTLDAGPRTSRRRDFIDRGSTFSDRDRRWRSSPERRTMTSRRSDATPF